jgi:hypothetical protein
MNMYLGTSTFLPNFGPIGLVAILEKQISAVTPEIMPGSSQNFNHRYILGF